LQRPVVTKAKKSVSNFKLRAGMPIGLKVTLRGDRMWIFLEKLVNVALPRVRDFRGVNPNAFELHTLEEMLGFLGMETEMKEKRYLDQRPS